eukprot:TRINITY_DN16010_c0_g1_i1.p1 TRINITY_DN16010_c0_g1~~TRINITY_DN16010_c0_g1_i1.p1  ORF type:complete len:182 (+),score=40.20 TRINITY_DN16010_c0_g1_i1:178-723(+)
MEANTSNHIPSLFSTTSTSTLNTTPVNERHNVASLAEEGEQRLHALVISTLQLYKALKSLDLESLTQLRHVYSRDPSLALPIVEGETHSDIIKTLREIWREFTENSASLDSLIQRLKAASTLPASSSFDTSDARVRALLEERASLLKRVGNNNVSLHASISQLRQLQFDTQSLSHVQQLSE